jgi:hypothetical protein
LQLTVAAAGRKKKKKICRGRGPAVVVAGRWLCWLPVVEMVAEKLTVMTMVAGTAERERECVKRQTTEKEKFWGGKLVFDRLWTQLSPPLEHENHIYL